MTIKNPPLIQRLNSLRDTLNLMDLAPMDRQMIMQEIEVIESLAIVIQNGVEILVENLNRMNVECNAMKTRLRSMEKK